MSRPLSELHVAVLLGGLSAGARGLARLRRGLRRRPGRAGRRESAASTPAAIWPPSWPRSSPTSCSTPCTAPGARTAASRACSRPSASPTPTPASWPRPWPWTRTSPRPCCASAGVVVPGGGLYDRHRGGAPNTSFAPPYVIKPNAEGSSVGVFLVPAGRQPSAEPRSASRDWAYGETGHGRALHSRQGARPSPLIGDKSGPRALTVTDITPDKGFYDYEAKYAPGGSVHELPADLPPHVFEAALRQAELAHVAHGLPRRVPKRLPL
jgi:D-alanine-D-alanine ligase